MKVYPKIVLGFACVLLIVWLVSNINQFRGDSESVIRIGLGVLFGALILLRQQWGTNKNDEEAGWDKENEQAPSLLLIVTGLSGAMLVLSGVVFRIHQTEWLGIILLLYSCLRWALPARYSRDIFFSVFLFYWIYPLPSQIFDPVQLSMQRLAILLSERVLHILNVRVWADGLILRTGQQSFGVPEACSGMRTAVTVFLCGIGIGALFRFRWYELAGLCFAGIIQVLLLNVIRICFMVKVSAEMQSEWSLNFLHDTAGVFLLVAVFLLHIEAFLWAAFRVKRLRIKTALEKGRMEPRDKASMYSPFWRMAGRIRYLIPLIVLIVIAMSPVIYRNRPFHRAMMISNVADFLAFTDIEGAERCSLTALALMPDDSELRTQRIKILLLRKKFDKALEELAKIPRDSRGVLHSVLEAWAMMGLNRVDKAVKLIDSLPEGSRMLPGVAIVRAELAAARGDTDGVVHYIVRAVDSPWVLQRARELFSYLAARQQWKTIATCHSYSVPYEYPVEALIVIHAFMQLNQPWNMGRLVEYSIEKWPNDTRFLEYLGVLASLKPGGKWEDMLADKLKSNIKSFTADELSVYTENCFRMSRPDLAWLLFDRLKEIDPKDPSLYVIPAQFSGSWFTFRKIYAGLPAGGEHDKIDLKLFYSIRKDLPDAPLLKEMTGSSQKWKHMQDSYLQKCLDEFERRDKKHSLSIHMQTLYHETLKMAGRDKDAKGKIAVIRKMYEEQRELTTEINLIDAKLSRRDLVSAWELLKGAMVKWPNDPILLQRLASLAGEKPGSSWEELFCAKLKSQLYTLSADELSVYIEEGFKLTRPDIAWQAYNQLQTIDASNPMLYLAPVKYSPLWFLFRNEYAGISSLSKEEKTDLKILYSLSRDWPPAPLAEDILAAQYDETKSRQYFEMCLAELDRREKEQGLSIRMRMMYPTVLGLLGKYGEAHARLDSIEKEYPQQKGEVLFRRAVFFDREGQWEKLYETLREYSILAPQPRIAVSLMKINALMHLDMGVYALTEADTAASVFRGAPEISSATAAILAVFGIPEEALFLLQKTDNYLKLPILPRLLRDTQRYSEANFVEGVLNDLQINNDKRQTTLLPHAELTVAMPDETPLSIESMLRQAEEMKEINKAGISPFLKGMKDLIIEWLERNGQGDCSDPVRWVSAGRDDVERAMALNELSMLLVRQKRYDDAIITLKKAVGFSPNAAMLWRVLIALTNGSDDIVRKAREMCPSDPEIWLAFIVTQSREKGSGDWAIEVIGKAVEEKSFSVRAITRAGDFMLRHDMPEAATKAAQYAVKNARSLLPAYVLGLRCGLQNKDESWAMLCARYAAESAVDPWPFYKMIGEIETSMLIVDGRTAEVLDKLRTKFPDEIKWTVKLGDFYLRNGKAQSALSVLESMLVNQPGNIELKTLLLASEAARQSGDLPKCVSILEKAYTMYPASPSVLNNLIYTLALDRKTLPRAMSLLPKLLEVWGDSLAALDTAAVVYFHAGKPDKAAECLKKAIKQVDSTDPYWLQLNPAVVDMEVYLGAYDYEKAAQTDDLRQTERDIYRNDVFPLAKQLMRSIKNRMEMKNPSP